MCSYPVPAAPVEVAEEIKGSQFITRVRNAPTVELARAFIREMNETYPDATHHCWAYIVGNPQSTTLIGCSDDGEPSGTAGKPMLKVLQHSGIGDIVAVCTRYYGGTKLGTGGLTRAYGNGVKLALDKLTTQLKIDYCRAKVALDYAQLKDFQHLLKSFTFRQLELDYGQQVEAKFELAEAEKTNFIKQLDDQFNGQLQCQITQ